MGVFGHRSIRLGSTGPCVDDSTYNRGKIQPEFVITGRGGGGEVLAVGGDRERAAPVHFARPFACVRVCVSRVLVRERDDGGRDLDFFDDDDRRADLSSHHL